MSGNILFDSYFTDRVIDNNGVSVADINVGLNRLHKNFNEYGLSSSGTQSYIAAEHEVGYPDLIALNSQYGSQLYWWWVLLFNRQDDAFEGIKPNWVYAIDSVETVRDFVNTVNNTNSTNNADSKIEMTNESRIGSTVELN